MTRKLLPGVAMALVLVVSTAATLALWDPPAAVPVSAPPDQFSAERALAHVRVIARDPHPIGSAANAVVRDYLTAQLSGLGLDPEVQRALGVVPRFGVAGMVENVVARLAGSSRGVQAILMVAHYDSVPTAPGASDDASAVATLLETARALKAGPPLRNDVIFLFTDGEESGLLGAAAFQAKHPWARDVGLVLNFEARGHTGPVLTFQTGPGNSRLIPEFARAVTRPAANSLMNTVYQTLPNDTDFTIFDEAGLMGLNFGFIDGSYAYHSPLDDIDHLDRRSLQHMGTYAMDLVRHFGDLDLATVAPAASDAVYFDVLGRFLVHYPGEWAVPLAVLLAAGYAGLIAFGIRRRWLTWGGLGAGFLALVLQLLAGLVVIWLAWRLAYVLHPQYATVALADIYNAPWYWLSFSTLAVAVSAALHGLLRRKIAVSGLATGALLWWLILALVSAFVLPGASFLALWPAAFSLIGLAVLAWRDRRNAPEPGEAPGICWIAFAALALTALPALALVSGFAHSLFVAMGFGFALGGAGAVLLLMGLLIPQFEFIGRANRWALPVAAALVAVGAFAAGSLSAGFDVARPWPNEVLYALDAQTGRAYWIGFANPDVWTVQFLGESNSGTINEFFPRAQGDFPKAPAAALDLAAPEVQLLDDSTQGTTRTLRLRVTSPRTAQFMVFHVVSPLTATLQVGDYPVTGRRQLQLSAPPPEGFEIMLGVPAGSAVQLLVVDRSMGLPTLPGFTPPARPADMMRTPDPDADTTMVSRGYTFP